MKINKTLIALTALIVLLNPIMNLAVKTNMNALTTFDLCFTTDRTGSKTERANLKQFAKRGILHK